MNRFRMRPDPPRRLSFADERNRYRNRVLEAVHGTEHYLVDLRQLIFHGIPDDLSVGGSGLTSGIAPQLARIAFAAFGGMPAPTSCIAGNRGLFSQAKYPSLSFGTSICSAFMEAMIFSSVR